MSTVTSMRRNPIQSVGSSWGLLASTRTPQTAIGGSHAKSVRLSGTLQIGGLCHQPPSLRTVPNPRVWGGYPQYRPYYESTIPSICTFVILQELLACTILHSPTTEPGRQGRKRLRGSPLLALLFVVTSEVLAVAGYLRSSLFPGLRDTKE